MNNTIFTLIIIFSFFSCVEPPEHDYGLVENLPVVINTDNVFTYSLYGDKYTSEDTYDLQLLLSDSIHKVITSLIVSDFAGSNRDTTVITVEKDSTVVDVFSITSNYSSNPTETEVDSVFYLPKQVSVKLDQFSGKLEFLMIRSDL